MSITVMKDKVDNSIRVASNVMLLIYVFFETAYKTIFGLYLQDYMEKGQCITGLLLLILFIVGFLRLNCAERIIWFKTNKFVIAYFIIRTMTFFITGCEYSVLRSVFFEVIYLIVLSNIIVSNKFCRKVIMRFFIIFNLILNIINTILYWFSYNALVKGTFWTDVIYNFARDYTYNDGWVWTYSSMYSNPNFIGMMTGIAIICSFGCLPKRINRMGKVAFGAYLLFSLYCIWYSNCSSAQLAVIAVVLAVLAVKYIKCLTKKRLVVIVLLCAVISTAFLYLFISSQEEFSAYTNTESKITELSNGRYEIWKDCYYAHKDELMFGCGNITLEKRDRYQYNLDKGFDLGYDIEGSLVEYYGPHNGYIGLIACAGILGLIAFILVVLNKIKVSKIINEGYWYLAIIFILIINIFECMLIINKNFCCLFLFLILAMDNVDNGEERHDN